MRFTSISPFRIKVTGRTKHHINVFGEELIIENAETALKQASKHTQCEIVDYTAAPIFMEGREKGAHEWIIEFKTPPKDLSLFTKSLDSALMDVNSDYKARRINNMTQNMPKVNVARQRLCYD